MHTWNSSLDKKKKCFLCFFNAQLIINNTTVIHSKYFWSGILHSGIKCCFSHFTVLHIYLFDKFFPISSKLSQHFTDETWINFFLVHYPLVTRQNKLETPWIYLSQVLHEPTYWISTPYLGNIIYTLQFPAAALSKQSFPNFYCSLKKNWKLRALDPDCCSASQACCCCHHQSLFHSLILPHLQPSLYSLMSSPKGEGWLGWEGYGQERSHPLPFPNSTQPASRRCKPYLDSRHHHGWGCSLSKTSCSIRYFQPNCEPNW